MPLPQAIVNRPEVPEELSTVWEAFWFLHSTRPTGMAIGAIPLSEMLAYWRAVTPTDFVAEKVILLRAMDNHYLTWASGNK